MMGRPALHRHAPGAGAVLSLPAHGRGHWFDPSSGHRRKPLLFKGLWLSPLLVTPRIRDVSASVEPLTIGHEDIGAARSSIVVALEQVPGVVVRGPDRGMPETLRDDIGVLTLGINRAAWVCRTSWNRTVPPTDSRTAGSQTQLRKLVRRRGPPSADLKTSSSPTADEEPR